jgi:hypothetical protein
MHFYAVYFNIGKMHQSKNSFFGQILASSTLKITHYAVFLVFQNKKYFGKKMLLKSVIHLVKKFYFKFTEAFFMLLK